MPSFGEVIIHMLTTVISSTIETAVTLITDIFLLFQMISANVGIAPPAVIIAATFVLSAIIYFLLKMFKGDLKNLIVAVMILTILLLFALFSFR